MIERRHIDEARKNEFGAVDGTRLTVGPLGEVIGGDIQNVHIIGVIRRGEAEHHVLAVGIDREALHYALEGQVRGDQVLMRDDIHEAQPAVAQLVAGECQQVTVAR